METLFQGQLDLADAERVVMSHTAAGQIEFMRSQLKAIIPATAGIGKVVYNGPSSEKDWVFGSSKNIIGGGGFALPIPAQKTALVNLNSRQAPSPALAPAQRPGAKWRSPIRP